MSKVSSGNNPSNSEALAQLKEQYMQRERDGEARHRDEVNELRVAHRAEIDKVRTESEKRLREVQDESNVKLNQKDMQYQKEIETLKSLYTKSRAQQGEGKKS